MPTDADTPQAEPENLNAQATFRVSDGDAADARLLAALGRISLSDVWRSYARLDDMRADAARVRAAHAVTEVAS